MGELNFTEASTDEILDAYLDSGSVLLRNFVNPEKLAVLTGVVDRLYEEVDDAHIYPKDMKTQGFPDFHSYLFEDKHYELLNRTFGGKEYWVSKDSVTRRIAAEPSAGQWQLPLGPHLDSFFHPFAFTVNFWVPFRSCGVETPSLGVVQVPFADALKFCGYDGGDEVVGGAEVWNFPRFDKAVRALAGNDCAEVLRLRTIFAKAIWTPAYSLGDAMMLSNWTLHFSYATPTMRNRRGNVELRFISGQTLDQLVEGHRAPPDLTASKAR